LAYKANHAKALSRDLYDNECPDDGDKLTCQCRKPL
jgi:hypothetical protein